MKKILSRFVLTLGSVLVIAGVAAHGALAEKPAEGAAKKFNPGVGMVKALDTDGDGKVSAAEFSKKSEERFVEMDADKDGFLTQDEIASHQTKMMERARAMQEKAKANAGNKAPGTEAAPKP